MSKEQGWLQQRAESLVRLAEMTARRQDKPRASRSRARPACPTRSWTWLLRSSSQTSPSTRSSSRNCQSTTSTYPRIKAPCRCGENQADMTTHPRVTYQRASNYLAAAMIFVCCYSVTARLARANMLLCAAHRWTAAAKAGAQAGDDQKVNDTF